MLAPKAAVAARLQAAPPPHVTAVEVAGPGFVNFRLADSWLHDVLRDVVTEGEDGYAAPDLGEGRRVNVEFVSANPTGPLHAGGGRWAAYGDALVNLQSINPIYVNFGVPQQSVGQIPVGRVVRVTTTDVAGAEWNGRVTAIDSMVDEATRNIQVQATLANPNGRLRPGMFVQTEVMLGAGQPVLALPASAIRCSRCWSRPGVSPATT